MSKSHLKYFNPNPLYKEPKAGKKPKVWRIGDCAVRAVCAATGMSWETAYLTMSESAMKAYLTGSLDAKGMFFGYSATDKAVKVFGMENYWGCQWRRHAGLIQKGGNAYYKLTRGTADGSTATDFNTDGTGYIEHSGALSADSGWQSAQAFDTNLMIPSSVGASDATHMCDYYWVNTNATTYALLGGSSDFGSRCGAFSLTLDVGVSTAYWSLGCAPSLKPLA